LSGAVGAEVKDFFAHSGKNRARGFQCFRFAADHKEQFAFLGAPSTASDRRIKKVDACRFCGGSDFAREGGRDRAGVNVNRSFFQRSEGATGLAVGVRTRTPQNFFERGRIADDCDQNVGGSGSFFGRSCETSPRSDQRVGAGCGAVPYDQRKSGSEKIVAHGTAHEAKSDEADSRLWQDCLHGKMD
jgi:hypothetical protein